MQHDNRSSTTQSWGTVDFFIMDLDFEMDRIRKYAKENNISISDSCMLHATAAKMNFYEEAINRIQSNPDGIPLELFTRDNVPVTVNVMGSLETTSEL